MHERDGRMDGRTTRDSVGGALTQASRGKKLRGNLNV